MTDSIIARHSQINAGAMLPASAEELAQKYQTLFQEYSRLKAKHTVLKKAVKKERTENASLQGNVKEKEKELRKLQGQLDVLAFHNERLSKRIEAVQELDTKESHFSLLGGTIKKALEKSTQALDAASVDLAKKIEENEELHAELSEINHIYTDNLNGLHIQIATLEKRVEELQDERALLHSETSSQSSVFFKEKSDLEKQINQLQDELATKTRLVDEYQQVKTMDDQSQSETDSATIAQLKSDLMEQSASAERQKKQLEKKITDLNETIIQLNEHHANQSEAATLRTKTLEKELSDLTTTMTQLRAQLEDNTSQKQQRLETMEKEIADLEHANTVLQQANDTLAFEKDALIKNNTSLRIETTGVVDQLTKEVHEKKELLDGMEAKISLLESQLEEKRHQLSVLQDQVASYEQALAKTNGSQAEELNGLDDNEEEDDDAPFVYPVPSSTNNEPQTNPAALTNGHHTQQDDVETMIQERESKMKRYYENQMDQLTEKLQMADSKAGRFASMAETLKEKLVKEQDEKQGLHETIEHLRDQVAKAKESLSITESKYQEQLDALTEYTTALHMQASTTHTGT